LILITFPVVPPDPLTVSVTVVVCVKDPLVPVIVTVGLPAGVVVAVVIVSVEGVPAVIDVGLNVPVAPLGNPLTLKPTLPLNPFNAPTLTVYVVLPPGTTVCVAGVALRLKSGVDTSKP